MVKEMTIILQNWKSRLATGYLYICVNNCDKLLKLRFQKVNARGDSGTQAEKAGAVVGARMHSTQSVNR